MRLRTSNTAVHNAKKSKIKTYKNLLGCIEKKKTINLIIFIYLQNCIRRTILNSS